MSFISEWLKIYFKDYIFLVLSFWKKKFNTLITC